MPHQRLGEILIDRGLVNANQVDAGLRKQVDSGQRLGSALIALGAKGDSIAQALAHQHGVPAARRKHFEAIDPATLALLPRALARRHNAVPLGIATRGQRELIVAMRDPGDAEAIAVLTEGAGMPVRPAAAPECYVHHYLDTLYDAGPPPAAPEPPPAAPPKPSAPVAAYPEPRGNPSAVGPQESEAELELAVDLAPRFPTPPTVIPAGVPPAGTLIEPMPEARVVAGGGFNLLGISGLRILSVIAFVVTAFLTYRHCNPPKETAVNGWYYCKHVGRWINFPDAGWRYLRKADQTQSYGPITAKGAYFYAGGTADIPDRALVVFTLDTQGRLPDDMSEAQFAQLLEGARKNMSMNGSVVLRMTECRVTHAREEMTGECTGTARYQQEERSLVTFFWIEEGTLVAAGFLSTEPSEAIRYDIDYLMKSITAEEP